jgi:hypothetical protein
LIPERFSKRLFDISDRKEAGGGRLEAGDRKSFVVIPDLIRDLEGGGR